MKIGINIIGLFPGKNGGAEQYIRNIVETLNRNREIDVFLFVNDEALPTFEENETLHLFVINLGPLQDSELNYYIDLLSLDVWFCPLFHLVPHECSIPTVVAVFDIQQEFFPQNFSKQELKMRRVETSYTMENADLILTISEFSKRTIIEKFRLPEEKIRVTYLDADLCFEDPIDETLMKEIKNKLPTEYIFYPANSWPHKNHLRLIKAYKILKDKYGISFKMVFTGDQKQEKKNIENFIAKNNLRDDIVYLGYLEQRLMPYVYMNAKMVVFPSLFEGFGIPLVEAMKVGVPLACSNSASIPEIAGDAAIYFDAEDINDIAYKIYKLYCDEVTQSRLKENAKKRKAIFSWENCANQTMQELGGVCIIQEEKDMIATPLVSVITPSYNQGEFIRETIDSVLEQDYSNIEYIVMDGGSTDETVDILKEYGEKIVWCSEKDEGQADAVNKGLKIARGKIIGWLNSDDTYCDGAIERVVSFFNTHPKVDMVYGEGYYIDKEGNVTDRYLTERYDKKRLAETCIICQPSAFFRREFVETVGGLDKNLQLCMDYDLWMKMAQQGRIAYIPFYLANSRMYEENKTMSRRNEVYREVCRTVKKYYGYVPHTWIIGYAHHLCDGRKKFLFYPQCIRLFIKYNYDNLEYWMVFAKKVVKKIIKPSGRYTEMEHYPDGWLGPVYHTSINTRKNVENFRITGQNILPFGEVLKVSIEIDGEFVGQVELNEKGDFEKIIKLNKVFPRGLHRVVLNMSASMSPMEAKIGRDKRKLSFLLKNMEMR